MNIQIYTQLFILILFVLVFVLGVVLNNYYIANKLLYEQLNNQNLLLRKFFRESKDETMQQLYNKFINIDNEVITWNINKD